MTASPLFPSKVEEEWTDTSGFELIINRIQNAVVITNLDGHVVWVNTGFSRMTEYRFEDVKGLRSSDFLKGAQTDPETLCHLHNAYTQRQSYKSEVVNYTKSGKRYWAMVEVQPVYAAGILKHFLEIYTDVTEQVLSRQNLEREYEFALTVLNTMGQGLTVVNKDWKFEYVNPAYARMTGYPTHELVGKSPTAFFLNTLPQANTGAYRSGGIKRYETRVQRADGKYVDLLVTSVPRVIAHQVDGSISVITDITESKLVEHELKVAKEVAENANRAKNEFLSRMSHDLRTPLNAVLGFTQLLELDDLSDDQSKSVQHILKAGRHLLTLINEVLDVARIETGTLLLSLEPINIEDILRETVTIIQPLAESHRVTVNHTYTGSPLWVMGDKQRLEQVMLNLLSNAIKYNIRDGRVIVSCYLNTDGNVRLEVKDTGIGIAGEKLSQLFTPFDRLGAEETSVEGIGIGLTLTKHLVEAMQGKIHVQSDLGKGTTMWVDLPKTYEGP